MMGHPTDPKLGTMPCDTHLVAKKENSLSDTHTHGQKDVHCRCAYVRFLIHKLCPLDSLMDTTGRTKVNVTTELNKMNSLK